MTHDRETWLQSIRSNPSDWQAMLVFADWLKEEGDLLAAEQWRFIAACVGPAVDDEYSAWLSVPKFIASWPFPIKPVDLVSFEEHFAATHSIRCMPTYPLTIEDVQAYLETAG